MSDHVVLLSIPGLRAQDVAQMPNLKSLVDGGDRAELVPSFPGVTCPVQANMTTGVLPNEHGVIANGFFWRDRGEVEMWTSPNSCIQAPQIWDRLSAHDESLTSAVWFPMHSKECGAKWICMPAPIHNPDGSESLWCYTRPTELYGEYLDKLGHFPLQHFWGPMANIKSSAWIVDSACLAAESFRPSFFYIYLTHLDYAPQKFGPDSAQTQQAVRELDAELGKLIQSFDKTFKDDRLLWLIASEYTIVPVNHVVYPNRLLREAGLIELDTVEGKEQLNVGTSPAFALADHQLSHVFVKDHDTAVINRVVDLFRKQEGIAEVLAGDDRDRHDLKHDLSGDVILVSEPHSWQAYYWWEDDTAAPVYARTVDIHRKPGYDPVEMFWDHAAGGVPLDATLVQGSHGAPAQSPAQRGVLLSSEKGVFVEKPIADTDIAELVLRQFGV